MLVSLPRTLMIRGRLGAGRRRAVPNLIERARNAATSASVAALLSALAFGCSNADSSQGASAGSAGSKVAPQAGAPSTTGSAGSAQTNAGAGGSSAGMGGEPQAASGSTGIAGNSGSGTESGGAASGSGGVSGGGSSGFGGANAGTGGQGGHAPSVGVPKNPVLPGFNADPQVALFGDRFYIYPTGDGFANWLGTKFHAWSSLDLVTWRDEGVVLDLGPDVSWADDRAWAPGIAFKGGTYYFYFSAAQAIGVATSTSPTGPFHDALGHELVKNGAYGVQAIDPYVFMDDDGRAYLYFGSSSSGRVVELNADMVSFKGTPQTLTVGGFREGSVGFKRKGKYYFMWSENDTRMDTYDVAYGIGTSPLGPFTKATVNPILKKDAAQGILGPGHNSVLALPNGDYYIVYHRFAIPGGDGTHREVCIDRLLFNDDGTIIPVKPSK